MQSIIVYRNPVEAAFWEGAAQAEFFPIIVGIVAFFAVFILANSFIVTRFFSWRNREVATKINLAVSAMIAVTVCYKMWL